ncbi:MAG: CBS domain-containing protein, partial [Candidatus Paceibacterota bacterium]
MLSVQEAVHTITHRPKQRLKLFRELPLPMRSAIFAQLSWKLQQYFILSLTRNEAVDILDHLDPRLVSSILARLPSERSRQKLIAHLKHEQRAKAEHFLSFHPKAAISLIHFNYVLLPDKESIGSAANAIHEHWEATGKFPEVLVHQNGELIGEVHFTTLVREPNRNALKKYVGPIESIPYHASRPDIIDAFAKTAHRKVVVLDDDGSVIGIIYSDDALELLGHEESSSLYTFAGVEAEERPFDSVWQKVRRRWKWLILNLGTAFLAAAVIGLFDDLIAAFVL